MSASSYSRVFFIASRAPGLWFLRERARSRARRRSAVVPRSHREEHFAGQPDHAAAAAADSAKPDAGVLL